MDEVNRSSRIAGFAILETVRVSTICSSFLSPSPSITTRPTSRDVVLKREARFVKTVVTIGQTNSNPRSVQCLYLRSLGGTLHWAIMEEQCTTVKAQDLEIAVFVATLHQPLDWEGTLAEKFQVTNVDCFAVSRGIAVKHPTPHHAHPKQTIELAPSLGSTFANSNLSNRWRRLHMLVRQCSLTVDLRITNLDASSDTPYIGHRMPSLFPKSVKRRRNISKPALANAVTSLPLWFHACDGSASKYEAKVQ